MSECVEEAVNIAEVECTQIIESACEPIGESQVKLEENNDDEAANNSVVETEVEPEIPQIDSEVANKQLLPIEIQPSTEEIEHTNTEEEETDKIIENEQIEQVESDEVTASLSSESPEETTPIVNRELKSILALSKEAKLDTNLTPRRKTIDNTKHKEGTPMSSKKPLKTSNFPVTAECELENYDVADENEQNSDKSSKKMLKKRKMSLSEASAEGATVDGQPVRKSTQGQGLPTSNLIMLKPNKDMFCWRCHHDGVNVACETCPRAYHHKCLKQIITDDDHWPCPECVTILKAENTQTRSKAMKGMTLEHLCSLLKFAVKRMIQCDGSEPFIQPVDEKQFPEYKNYIIQPMNLTMLEKNIKDNLYGSTQAFEADAKWILHNSIIFNSWDDRIKAKTEGVQGKKENVSRNSWDHSKLTSTAKTILKICKQEMAEIENCPSCYLNANTKKHTWFVEVCPKPHLLVWAKLKGFPYWPAKVMSFSSTGMVDVRFFGAHDKAWVSSKDCYIYSNRDPNSGKQKRNDIMECVRELEVYVDNLRKIYGKVAHAPIKTPLEPGNEDKYLKLFLPSYDVNSIKTNGKDNLIKNDNEKNASYQLTLVNDNQANISVGQKPDNAMKNENVPRQAIPKTRIEYRHSTGSKPRWVVKPLKTVVIKKRHSIDNAVETSKKRRESSRIELQSSENIKSDNDKADLNSTQKIKISDQLIQKLSGEITDETEQLNTEEKSDGETIKNGEESGEEIPEKIVENKEVINVNSAEEVKSTHSVLGSEIESAVNGTENDDIEGFFEPTSVMDIDEDKIRNIIHSSLALPSKKLSIEKQPTTNNLEDDKRTRKRKRNDEPDQSHNVPPTKMVKLVPIERILQRRNDDKDTQEGKEKSDETELVDKTSNQQGGAKEIINRKDSSESQEKQIITDNDESTNDMPITIKSEKESDDDNDVQYMEAKRKYMSALNISEKQKVPVKPKPNEIRTRSKTEEKRSKSIDTAAKSVQRRNSENLSDVETRKSVSSNEHPIREIYIKSLSKMQTPKHKARKSFPTPNYAKKNLTKILPKPMAEDPIKAHPVLNSSTSNLIVLPKLHYTKTTVSSSSGGANSETDSPVIAVVPRLNANPLSLSCPPLRPSTSVSNNKSTEELQTQKDISDSSNNLQNNTIQDNETRPTAQLETELEVLKEILPENLSRNMSEILCQPPPKLKPKPINILNTINDNVSAIPNTAGPVTARMNLLSQKMGDYFRGLVMEVIQELGKSSNPEATISSLKMEIEELNHRHTIELAEIRRNVSVVLRDIQKSIVEERERIINETKANCEIETLKKVEEAKSKQWCANCLKEAQFYCCWNTSYCDYPCQQKHWLKHMSKCTQTASQSQMNSSGGSSTHRPGQQPQQQLVLTPTTAPRFRTLIAKPQKVYLKRTNTSFKGQSPGNHITLVESTPGNFELVGGSGPITVNGKILASTSVMEKIQSGNIVTVTAPSSGISTESTTSANYKVTISSPISKNNSSDSEH